MSEESSGVRPRCKFLTCKSMMVYGEDFEQDPEYQMGLAELTCLCTSKCYGPDNGDVNLAECSNPERPCFREV